MKLSVALRCRPKTFRRRYHRHASGRASECHIPILPVHILRINDHGVIELKPLHKKRAADAALPDCAASMTDPILHLPNGIGESIVLTCGLDLHRRAHREEHLSAEYMGCSPTLEALH